MTFAGTNHEFFPVVERSVADVGGRRHHLHPTGERVYLNGTSLRPGPVPTAWPKLQDATSRQCVSIRPNPVEVASGRLDAALITFLRGAPMSGPPSLLGLWHEASSMGYPIHPDALRAAQRHVHALARAHNPNVRVGAIDQADISARNARLWMARNLDFYCCDLYDNRECNEVPTTLLDHFHSHCNALMDSGRATIGVSETNSLCPKRRPYWFTHVWSWLQAHGYKSDHSCFLTYWNPHGAYSGPWLPHDTATIDALYTIFHKSAA